MMKIEQKIATGGVNKTNTPILKLRMKKALFEPAKEARHIAHCDSAVSASSTSNSSAAKVSDEYLCSLLNFISALLQ
jgi:hypothetical protein